jgi:Protein of unknown function (DUF3667)
MKKWGCPGCGCVRATNYCPECGEEPLRERDLSLPDLIGQFARALSSIDGRLARSFRTLLTRPGALTEAYVAGRRRAYLGPLPLFLLANALFFAVQSMTRFDIFSSPLDSHLHHQDWSVLAQHLVAARLADRGLSLEAYAPLFDHAAVLNAKALIVLMALAFVPFLPPLFYGAHRRFGAHVVFALHLYAFILLLLSFSLLLAEGQLLAGGDGLASPGVDLTLTVFNVTACAAYLYLAAAFYGSRGLPRLAKSVALALAVGAIALGYRFAIFMITLHMA